MSTVRPMAPGAARKQPIDLREDGGLVKVLHVINGEYYAGAERVQELLAASLPAFGYRASFACLMQGQFQRRLEQSDHESCVVPMRSRFDAVGVARRIAAHATGTGCRLIHTHTPRGALVGGMAASFARLPLVHHVHSPTARNTDRGRIDTVYAWVERAALVRARALIPVSRSLAEDLRHYGYPKRRISSIPNGVALTDHVAEPGRRPQLTLGVVALFRPRKGIELLLRSVARLRRRGCTVRIRAVGAFESEEYEARVRGLADSLGVASQVEWRGFRSDVVAELEQVDALALPSLFGEGMPMVVLEAMAVGLPIIASRVEGVPEVVREGIDGVLVTPGDEDAFAAAIEQLAADRQALRNMGTAARARQRQAFSDVAMAENLSRVYDRILGQPARRLLHSVRSAKGVSG